MISAAENVDLMYLISLLGFSAYVLLSDFAIIRSLLVVLVLPTFFFSTRG